MTHRQLFAGIDVGASHTKFAILDQSRSLVGHDVRKSGTDFPAAAQACLESALRMAQTEVTDIVKTISTGYGRKTVSFADDSKTEIGCHAKGCYLYFPMAMTIIDIGGQDNKIIKLDQKGRRTSFKMNRKCAAGTGAFLEEMSARLNTPLEEMDNLARQSEEMVKLGSFCTVFSATEVLEEIRRGKKLPDIVKGLFFSVIRRVMEMDSFSGDVVMTGGVVAHNRYIAEMTAEIMGQEILVPEYAQLTGAIGAALYAMG
jgi:predicted CoA-substrate-specific enzyme activase